MATKKRYLTGEQRLILEENGVIDAPQVPRSDQLEESIRARGWGLDVSVSAKGFAVAKVKSGHGSFDGAGDHSDVAIVEALCATLKARPRKVSLFDPAVDQAAGVQDERGPVAGGAPDADWAERLTDPDAYDAFIDRASADLLGGPNDDTHVPETGLPRIGFGTESERRVRENFPAEFAGGDEVCRACGVTIEAHDPEVCAGGTPAQRSGRRKAKYGTPESDAANGDASLSDDPTHPGVIVDGVRRTDVMQAAREVVERAVNGNGAHDDDDVLLDPKTVVATLTEAGIPIVHNGVAYSHPSGMPVYSNAWVEGEMRGMMAGRAR